MKRTVSPSPNIRDLIKPIAGVGSLKASSMVFTMIASIIVARELGPAAYGQVAFVLAVVSLLSIPSNNAMTPLLVREVSVHEQVKNWPLLKGLLNWSRRVTAGAVLLTMIPLVAWTFFTIEQSDSRNAELFIVAAPLLLFWALAGRVSSIFLGLKKTILAQCFDWLVSPVVYLLCVCSLWYADFLSPITVFSSTLFSLALATSAGYLVLQKQLPNPIRLAHSEDMGQAWYVSWRYFVLIQIVSVASIRVPVLFMGFLSDETEIGFYRVAENVASLVAVSLLIVNTVLGPQVSRLYANNQLAELGKIARSVARIALSFTLPVALIVGYYRDVVVELVFGAEYAEASTALILLLASQIVNVACGSVGLILSMTGLEQRALKFWLIALAVNIILCVILIPVYGATGGAAAVATSTVLWNILLLVFIRKQLGVRVAAV